MRKEHIRVFTCEVTLALVSLILSLSLNVPVVPKSITSSMWTAPPVWSPDSNFCAIEINLNRQGGTKKTDLMEPKQTSVIDYHSGREMFLEPHELYGLQWSPDSKTFAALSRNCQDLIDKVKV